MNRVLDSDLINIAGQDIEWEKLRDKTVMVTGASGMVGSYLVRTMLKLNKKDNLNIHIVCVVRNVKKIGEDVRLDNNAEILLHDVTKPIEYSGKIDYIIHAASPASPLIMRDDPVGTIATNVLGTFNTLELARQKNASGYMFISSREIYGQPSDNQEFFQEDTYGFVDPLDPRSCYPEGKKASETMCASFQAQYGLNTKIARLAHTYGPGMSIYDGRVQADFLKNVLFNEDIIMKSEGLPVRTYTYIADAVAGMFRILLNGEEIVYNIGDENAKISIRGLAELLVKLTPEKGLSVKMEIPEGGTKGCAPFTLGILDSSRLRGIGWKPQYTIEEGFLRTIEYLEIEKKEGNL